MTRQWLPPMTPDINSCDKSCQQFKFQQPYKSWKTKDFTISSVVKSHSKPFSNYDNYNDNGAQINMQPGRPIYSRQPNPIKHWRKQLIPREGSAGSRLISIRDVMDTPNGINTTSIEFKKICDASYGHPNTINTYYNYLKDNSIKKHDCKFDNNLGKFVSQTCNNNNKIRRASTIINKNYYTTTKAYLQSRVKLYEQRQSFSPISNTNNQYNYPGPNGAGKPASNSLNGSQVFYSLSEYQNASNCANVVKDGNRVRIIYKPNNMGFKQQGAVSSSLRIAKQKVDTINKNAVLMRNDWGPTGVSAAKYRGSSETPYFEKSRYETINCANSKRSTKVNKRIQPTGGSGNHTVCFYTPSHLILNNFVNNKTQKTGPGNKFITSKPISCKESLAHVRQTKNICKAK